MQQPFSSDGSFVSVVPPIRTLQVGRVYDENGDVVTRMSQKFKPPQGEILAVRTSTVLVRHAKEGEQVRCSEWKIVLPEIEYLPTLN